MKLKPNIHWRVILYALLAGMLSISSPAAAQGDEGEWQEFVLAPGVSIEAIYFVDKANGLAVGLDENQQQPVLLLTSDAGETWIPQTSGVESGAFHTIAFAGLVGYIGGQDFSNGNAPLIIRSLDGGHTWALVTTPAGSGMVTGIFITQDDDVWARVFDADTGSAQLWYSSYGLAFSPRTIEAAQGGDLLDFAFPIPGIGYAVGQAGADAPVPLALKSSDGGQTWVVLPLSEGVDRLNSVYFLTSEIGWLAGAGGEEEVILATNDGGVSWDETRLSGSTVSLAEIIFRYYYYGYSVGQIKAGGDPKGILYRMKDDGKQWEELLRIPSALRCLEATATRLFTCANGPPYNSILWKNEPPAPALAWLGLFPDFVELDQGQGQDDSGNPLPLTNQEWLVDNKKLDDCRGKQSCGIRFDEAGDHTVTVKVQHDENIVSGTADVQVNSPEAPEAPATLTAIGITPNPAQVEVGQTEIFHAQGEDPHGDPYALLDPKWQVFGSDLTECQGQSSCSITFNEAGEGEVTVTDQGIAGTAQVAVIDLELPVAPSPETLPQLAEIEIQYSNTEFEVGKELTQYRITCYGLGR
jgi:photosystem II stability/assembly factor-like uncharacterized protein